MQMQGDEVESILPFPSPNSLEPSTAHSSVHDHPLLRLRGGKGGFGSNLRAAGKQKLTDNFDACRDLNGRRIRHKTAEQKLEDWKAEAQERELEKIAAKHLKDTERAAAKAQEVEVNVQELRGETKAAVKGVKDAVQHAVKKEKEAQQKAQQADGGSGSDQEKNGNKHTNGKAQGAVVKRKRIDALEELSSDDDSDGE